ncbi:MAG: AraC family transcriptional regulator [Spirochaetota bacterium]
MINYYLPLNTVPEQRSGVSVKHSGRRYHLRIEHFSHARIETSWPAEHRHATYHVLMFLADSRMGFDGAIHPVRKNDIVLIAADMPHRFVTAEDGSATEYYEITFDLVDDKGPLIMPFHELLPLFFPSYGTAPSTPIVHIPIDRAEELNAVFNRLPAHAAHTMKDNFFGLAVSAGLIEFLAVIMSADTGTNDTRRSQKAESAVRFIYLNYHRRFTLEEVGDYCRANPQYISRLFHREMKKTIMEYANEVRIRIAERMLKSREYRIREVARMTGFEDEFYFNKVFKQITGFTPGSLLRDA